MTILCEASASARAGVREIFQGNETCLQELPVEKPQVRLAGRYRCIGCQQAGEVLETPRPAL